MTKALSGPPAQENPEPPVKTDHPECHVKTCSAPTDGDKVFCMPHWAKLPQEIKERMVDAYRVEKHERGLPNPSWDMALQQAINILSR